MIVVQQTETSHHLDLIVRDTVSLTDNILALEINDRFNSFPCLLAGLLRRFLVYDHIGFYTGAKNSRDNILSQ